jgi:hypothetical protein
VLFTPGNISSALKCTRGLFIANYTAEEKYTNSLCACVRACVEWVMPTCVTVVLSFVSRDVPIDFEVPETTDIDPR